MSTEYQPVVQPLRSGRKIPGMSFTTWRKKSQKQAFICKVWYRPFAKAREKGILIEGSVDSADAIIYNREKDASKVTADWFSELLSTDPWFKDVVPDVSDPVPLARTNQWLTHAYSLR
jgi:hypothetical protein